MDDTKTLELIKKLISEVKEEMKSKKLITEEKTPQKVFKSHEKNIKEYVSNNLFKVLQNAEK